MASWRDRMNERLGLARAMEAQGNYAAAQAYHNAAQNIANRNNAQAAAAVAAQAPQPDRWGGGRPQPVQPTDPTPGPGFVPELPNPDPPPKTLQSTQTKKTYGGKVQVIAYYSDGTTEVVDEWEDKSAGEAAADIFRNAGLDPAFVDRLMATINDVYAKNIDPSKGQILNTIYNSDAYKQRFKANEIIRGRIADGQGRPGDRMLSPKEYIDLENSYRTILQQRSMPEGYYDTPDDFTNLIANSISAAEFTSRVDTAASALNQADQSVVNSLQRYYNLTKSDLVAYLLDPTRATPILNARASSTPFGLNSADELQRIYETSEVGGMADRQGLGVGRGMAEEIVDLGKKDRADDAFQVAGAADSDLKRLGSLYGQPLDFKDLVKETLNLSGGVESGRRRRKFASRERAAFSQQSALDSRSLKRMQDV